MSEENIGGEEGIIDERRKKLENLRSNKKAYINDFLKEHYAVEIHKQNDSFTKEELVEKNIDNNKKNTFIVSSNADTVNNLEDMFHVKQEKFLINNNEYRYIDVITVK